MVELNERIIKYMECNGFQDIVLNIENITSWCAPPLKEMSVGFTVEEEAVMFEKGYVLDESILGKVYYPKEGIEIQDKIIVKYVDYPWISCFEVEGVEILKKESEDELPDNGFSFEGFGDILYSSDNESSNESGGNENVSNFEQSFGICGSE